MTVLLDANVLIALLVDDHVHHAAAENWFADLDGSFATCPITQGSLMRLLIREGQAAATARVLDRQVAAIVWRRPSPSDRRLPSPVGPSP